MSLISQHISLNNQPCMTRPTLIGLNPDEYNQELCYYPFIVNLDRCNGICNILNDTSSICVPNKGEDVYFSVFNMISGTNESSSKQIPCKRKCKFDGRKFNSHKKWSNYKCGCDCKNLKLTCVQKKRLYLESWYLHL